MLIADCLSDALLARLSIDRALAEAGLAIVACSVDAHGWPHPAMLSSLEVVALDAHHLRVATRTTTRTTRHLKDNGLLTLIIADERGVYYIKGRATVLSSLPPCAPDHATFNVRVEQVRQDLPGPEEDARILSGIRAARSFDPDRARDFLRALLTAAPAAGTDT